METELKEYKKIKEYAKSIDLGCPCGFKHSKNRMLFTDWNAHYNYSYKEKPMICPLELIKEYVKDNCNFYYTSSCGISSTIAVYKII